MKEDNSNWEIVDKEPFMEGREVVRVKKFYLGLLSLRCLANRLTLIKT